MQQFMLQFDTTNYSLTTCETARETKTGHMRKDFIAAGKLDFLVLIKPFISLISIYFYLIYFIPLVRVPVQDMYS